MSACVVSCSSSAYVCVLQVLDRWWYEFGLGQDRGCSQFTHHTSRKLPASPVTLALWRATPILCAQGLGLMSEQMPAVNYDVSPCHAGVLISAATNPLYASDILLVCLIAVLLSTSRDGCHMWNSMARKLNGRDRRDSLCLFDFIPANLYHFGALGSSWCALYGSVSWWEVQNSPNDPRVLSMKTPPSTEASYDFEG